MIDEIYTGFLDRLKMDGFLSPKNMFTCSSRKKTELIKFQEYVQELNQLIPWANSLTRTEKFRIVKTGMYENDYFCPALGVCI